MWNFLEARWSSREGEQSSPRDLALPTPWPRVNRVGSVALSSSPENSSTGAPPGPLRAQSCSQPCLDTDTCVLTAPLRWALASCPFPDGETEAQGGQDGPAGPGHSVVGSRLSRTRAVVLSESRLSRSLDICIYILGIHPKR